MIFFFKWIICLFVVGLQAFLTSSAVLPWGPWVKDEDAKICPVHSWVKQSQEVEGGCPSNAVELSEFG